MAPASVMSPSFGLSESLAACVFVYEAASFNRRPSLIPAHLLFYFLFLFCSFCRRSVWCTLRAAPNGPPLMIDLDTLISGGMFLLAAGFCPCDRERSSSVKKDKVDVQEILLHGTAADSNGLLGGELIRHETAVCQFFSLIFCVGLRLMTAAEECTCAGT